MAFLGNMNNNHFAMARFLRNRGVGAELLLFEHEFDHFHPAADTYDLSYKDFTRQLSWGSSTVFLRTSPAQIRKDLASYDVLIGCGFAPAYCEKAGRNLDIFVPYGGDIWADTSYRLVAPHRLPSYWSAVFYQRKGVPRSKVVHLALTNRIYETQWERHRGASERWIEGFPMVHSPTYAAEQLSTMADRTHWAWEFRRLRQENDLLVVYHARHYWKCSPADPNAKGTDKLLRAWASFRKKKPALRAALVTLEYGRDVHHSKALIANLGITDSVVWLPKMSRKDLMIGLNMADIVCGEFENSWMTSGVLYEALVVGKPILAWRDDAYYRDQYPNLYPILNAKDADSIAARLADYSADPERARRIGEQGRRWYEEEIVKRALDKYLHYIGGRVTEIGKC